MERLKTRKFVVAAMLVGLMAFVGGCHYTSDGHRGYSRGYYRDGSYREGFRDGRTYEDRRDNWRDRRYYDRYGYYRGRW